MLFTEGRFFLFFFVVLAVHWGLRGAAWRKRWLLLVSYAFYAGWDWRFLSLIWISTAVDYVCGRAMAHRAERRARRPFLWISLAVNLGILGFFKYWDFFATSAAGLAAWFGFGATPAVLDLVLPVGISFYTFQTMSYALDVYRGRLRAEDRLVDFALFVAFFPQLVAGPIVRAVEFLPQLAVPRRFTEHVRVRPMLTLFLGGFVKKACVADGIAAVADPVFADPGAYTQSGAWIAALLYHVQIYCDFSGYSDMAIATAGLLGYRLPLNFNFPYFARSIGDFWRRWHISLSTWMRDYVFLPLVGRGPSPARRVWSMLLTMGACGVWHGAGWQYASFGFLHGFYIVTEELWVRSPLRRGALARAVALASGPLLTVVVLLTWPVFRISDFDTSMTMFAVLFGAAGGEQGFGPVALAFLGACTAVHWAFYRGWTRVDWDACPRWAFPAFYGFAWAMVLPWVADGVQPFIYFQF